ncbi:MAG TPA: four helix bundle protein [Chitinophagaceae bacterium]|nr:four helix bundle protein [Chitinophagaceae bacterium]
MLLQPAHTKLNVYQASRALPPECYKLTSVFPQEEKFAMVQQIRRAALSVHLNIAEGCSGKSGPERNRHFEIARGSVIEIDTALDIACDLGYASSEKCDHAEKKLSALLNYYQE